MATFGSLSLLIALVLTVYSLLAGAAALWLEASGRQAAVDPARLGSTARRAGIAGFVAVTAAAVALVASVFANDFSIAYITEHSNRALPGPYKFASVWAGQEGSLVLWAWLLGAYGFVLRLTHKRDRKLYAYAGVVLAAIQSFFLLLVNFPAPPFALWTNGPVPEDGFGLSPLLQYPEMVIHPPMLYLGYVGFSVPFAFAMGALIMRYPGERWIRITRVWTLVTWLFLTCGVFLGMHWAYAVLGWGGYWGWDPVENASVLPWLTGTAFLHSVMMQEKKGMMKSWNIWLIFITFLLSILGTLLTRGGLVSSVHAFAKSPIGTWFTVFLLLSLAVCVLVYALRRDHLKSAARVESLVSREASFLFNSLVLLAAALVILWGTLYPIVSETFEGVKVTVGPAWYNRTTVPVGLFLLLLMGVGPLLPWRSASLKSIRRNFVLPAAALWAVALLCFGLGVRPWKDGAFDAGSFYALVGFSLAAAVAVAIVSEFVRGARVVARQTGKNGLVATYLLIRRNRRRYGGYLVHLGVVLAMVGFAGTAFNRSTESELGLNQKLTIGPYQLENIGAWQDSNANYDSEYALLSVTREGRKQFEMTPEKRVYLASQQPETRVAIHSTAAWDLYVVYEGVNPDTGNPIIKAILNPLVNWIWVGLLGMVLGTLVALKPAPRPAATGGKGGTAE